MILGADPLDDFLAGAGAGTELGERLETIGLLLSLPGILLAVGLIVFIRFVHTRGSPEERWSIMRALATCALLVLIGGLVEVAGAVAIGGGPWIEDLTSGTSSSLIRLAAGAMLTLAFLRPPAREPRAFTWRHVIGVTGALAGALSFATDGHTVSQGNLLLHASLDVVHVLAAGIWVGGIAGLLLMAIRRRRRLENDSMAPSIVRFSSVATLAIVTVAAAGLGMSFLIVDSIGDYVATSWGRLLLLKVALVAIAVGIGAYNHFVVVPALEVDPRDASMLSRARRTISAEATILLVVTLVTVFLTGASINQ